jgi:hypothetical protein
LAALNQYDLSDDAGIRILYQKVFKTLQEAETKIVQKRYEKNITPEKQREIIRSRKFLG